MRTLAERSPKLSYCASWIHSTIWSEWPSLLLYLTQVCNTPLQRLVERKGVSQGRKVILEAWQPSWARNYQVCAEGQGSRRHYTTRNVAHRVCSYRCAGDKSSTSSNHRLDIECDCPSHIYTPLWGSLDMCLVIEYSTRHVLDVLCELRLDSDHLWCYYLKDPQSSRAAMARFVLQVWTHSRRLLWKRWPELLSIDRQYQLELQT